MRLRPLDKSDWYSVSKIYSQGIATGIATFETECPTWEQWNSKYLLHSRLVAVLNGTVIGFAALAAVSKRAVYNGVAEVSVYVSEAFKGKHVGERLLKHLIRESEANGIWTLQANIFSENNASINLHLKCGFRIVGARERIGKLKGRWYDNQLLERRSEVIK
ncbi:N-acetyltransferase [Snuella sp. CAU 1569]|uniref:N-acetyltransferase n=1 Tax=Snuella sedimenti TaxID=2798802 RepID=A0A8J7IRY6_9FLAO|nr:N-acetyltransferase [Snuella sedimenti]